MSFNIVKICSESNILYMLVQIPTITALEWNVQGANLKKSYGSSVLKIETIPDSLTVLQSVKTN